MNPDGSSLIAESPSGAECRHEVASCRNKLEQWGFNPRTTNHPQPQRDEMTFHSPSFHLDALARDKAGHLHIAMIGNFPPRQCGLATYTHDSWTALLDHPDHPTVDIYAMDDGQVSGYGPVPAMLIEQGDPQAYARAAQAINASGAHLAWVQHEFGIFGGEAGSHLLSLVNRLETPFVVTFHTVLEKPDQAQRRVMDQLTAAASGLVVMTETGRQILERSYGVDPSAVTVIAHGVPDRPYEDPAAAKDRLGLDSRPLVLTFGLLSPDKGIRHMIEAMPIICGERPDTHYVVLGATHPHLIAREGERHREALVARADELGVDGNVSFVDRFVGLGELLDWLAAADIYVTPYLNPAQIVSGTLSYAVGLGKPVVSTPYSHAAELLSDGCGMLAPFGSAQALGEAVSTLLRDPEMRQAKARQAYALGRTMTWARNAEAMMLVMRGAVDRSVSAAETITRFQAPPRTRLAPILRMTDGTGMLQHSIAGIADRDHGYCIDDNARALMLMAIADDLDAPVRNHLASTFASFVQHAWNPDTRTFRNFMSYDRSWLEDEGSEDSNGRTLWALGVAARGLPLSAMRDWARRLFDQCAEHVCRLSSPRTRAFAMLGAAELLWVDPDHLSARALLADGAAMLNGLLAASRRPDWTWFEIMLSYDNTRLPEALIRAGMILGDRNLVREGLETLEWITGQTRGPGLQFRSVGTDSFGQPFAPPALFDQQPLEAWAMIDACHCAYQASRDPKWLQHATSARDWFLGANVLGKSLVDAATGECHDGLTPTGVNLNHGAESILSWQFAKRAHDRLMALASDQEPGRTTPAQAA